MAGSSTRVDHQTHDIITHQGKSPSREPAGHQPAQSVQAGSAEGLQASTWYTKRAQQRWVVPASGMRRLRRASSSAGTELASFEEHSASSGLQPAESTLKCGVLSACFYAHHTCLGTNYRLSSQVNHHCFTGPAAECAPFRRGLLHQSAKECRALMRREELVSQVTCQAVRGALNRSYWLTCTAGDLAVSHMRGEHELSPALRALSQLSHDDSGGWIHDLDRLQSKGSPDRRRPSLHRNGSLRTMPKLLQACSHSSMFWAPFRHQIPAGIHIKLHLAFCFSC